MLQNLAYTKSIKYNLPLGNAIEKICKWSRQNKLPCGLTLLTKLTDNYRTKLSTVIITDHHLEQDTDVMVTNR